MQGRLARYLRTYSIYLIDHMTHEEEFFDKAESEILSREEEYDMYEQFKSVMIVSTKSCNSANFAKITPRSGS